MRTSFVYGDDWLMHVVLDSGVVYIFNTEPWPEWESGLQSVYERAITRAESLARNTVVPFCLVDLSRNVGQIKQDISDAGVKMTDQVFQSRIH